VARWPTSILPCHDVGPRCRGRKVDHLARWCVDEVSRCRSCRATRCRSRTPTRPPAPVVARVEPESAGSVRLDQVVANRAVPGAGCDHRGHRLPPRETRVPRRCHRCRCPGRPIPPVRRGPGRRPSRRRRRRRDHDGRRRTPTPLLTRSRGRKPGDVETPEPEGFEGFLCPETGRWCARGDLNPHALSDTGT
jgi:hypothetical protein